MIDYELKEQEKNRKRKHEEMENNSDENNVGKGIFDWIVSNKKLIGIKNKNKQNAMEIKGSLERGGRGNGLIDTLTFNTIKNKNEYEE